MLISNFNTGHASGTEKTKSITDYNGIRIRFVVHTNYDVYICFNDSIISVLSRVMAKRIFLRATKYGRNLLGNKAITAWSAHKHVLITMAVNIDKSQ